MTAVLKITDGSNFVSLLNGEHGIYLESWRPQIQTFKNGGTFVDSQLANERQLVDAKFENSIETLSIKISADCQDTAIENMQRLIRILEQAKNYWISDSEPDFVWIERKASNESKTEYAIIKSYRIPEEDQGFSQPFTGIPAVKNNIQLIIERGPWLQLQPGTSECVQISNFEYKPEKCVQLLLNPGFELGFDYWDENIIDSGQVNVSSTDPHSGLKCIAIGTGNYDGYAEIYQDAPVVEGSTLCEFSFWYNNVGLDEIEYLKFKITSIQSGSTLHSGQVRISRAAPWTQYTYFSGIYIPVGTTSIRVSFYVEPESVDAGVTIYAIDDIIVSGDIENSVISTGSPATCNGNYIINAMYPAYITHSYRYTSSSATFSANLQTIAIPFDALPTPVSTGDILYIGSSVGVFGGLVFNVSVAGSGYTNIEWEYWNGAAWTSLSPNPGDKTSDLTVTGINSISFVQPSNWATTNINAVTAYWIRGRVINVPGVPVTPVLSSRIYNPENSYIEIQPDQIKGDYEALIQSSIENMSATIGDSRIVDRCIFGSRSVDRGPLFQSHINLTNAGVPMPGNNNLFDSSINAARITGGVSDTTTPAGQRMLYTSAIAAAANMIMITPETAAQDQYNGSYRALMRVYQTNGSINTVYAKLIVRFGSDIVYSSDNVYIDALTDWKMLDLGKFTLTPRTVAKNEISNFRIEIWMGSTANGTTVRLYDLILIPTDEYSGEFSLPPDSAGFSTGIGNDEVLFVDSIRNPKMSIRAVKLDDSLTYMRNTFSTISRGEFALEPRETIRVWYVFEDYLNSAGTSRKSEPFMLNMIKVFSQDRYLGMRGNE